MFCFFFSLVYTKNNQGVVMKSKYIRLTLVIVMLVLSLALLTFGVYSIVVGNSGVSNTVSFDSGDDNVFVRINAEYTGPELSSQYTETYSYELDRQNEGAYDENPVNIPGWTLGQTNFTTTETVITFTFKIDNLNSQRALGVEFRELAYDPDQKFTTAYAQAQSEEELATAQTNTLSGSNINTVNIDQIVIPESGTLYVKLVYTLVNFNEQFQFLNNIDVVFQSIEQ